MGSKKKTDETRLTAYKSNSIIYIGDAQRVDRWDALNATHLKIAMFSAAQVQPEDTSNTDYTMKFSQYAALCQLDKSTSGGKDYKRLFREARQMASLGVEFTDANGDLVGFNWLTGVRVSPKTGTMTYNLDKNLLPFYKSRSGPFALVELLDYMPLRGKHSLMLYEFLAKWRSAGKVYQTIDDLRQQLRVSSDLYPKNANFIQRVVEGAITEINEKATVAFRVRMVVHQGKNMKIEGVSFYIDPIKTGLTQINNNLIEMLVDENVGVPVATSIVATYSRERILGNIAKAKELAAAGKIKKSLPATICAAIRDDYAGAEAGQGTLFDFAPEADLSKEVCPECGGAGRVTNFETNKTSDCPLCHPAKPVPAPGTEDPDAPWKFEGDGLIIAKELAAALKR